jgi:hypothetical protein
VTNENYVKEEDASRFFFPGKLVTVYSRTPCFLVSCIVPESCCFVWV